MSLEDVEIIELEEINPSIEYKYSTPKYGRAYFTFCIERNERGEISKIWIGTRQQPDKKGKLFLYNTEEYASEFSLNSWEHKGIKEPVMRRILWCKEHNCEQLRVLTPKETSVLTITRTSFDIAAYFQKENVFE